MKIFLKKINLCICGFSMSRCIGSPPKKYKKYKKYVQLLTLPQVCHVCNVVEICTISDFKVEILQKHC